MGTLFSFTHGRKVICTCLSPWSFGLGFSPCTLMPCNLTLSYQIFQFNNNCAQRSRRPLGSSIGSCFPLVLFELIISKPLLPLLKLSYRSVQRPEDEQSQIWRTSRPSAVRLGVSRPNLVTVWQRLISGNYCILSFKLVQTRCSGQKWKLTFLILLV